MTRSLILAAALLAVPASTAALAADKPAKPAGAAINPRLKAEFAATDTNKDGVLSRAEVSARVGRMDVGRAKLTPAQAQELSAVWFARADANRDGKVTPFEMQKLLAATAKRYDTNGDGVVSVAERQAARSATLAEVQRAGPPRQASRPQGR